MRSGQQGIVGGKTALHPERKGKAGPLAVQCHVDAATGKIKRKTEVTATRRNFYDYEYDADGRLFRVFRNELLQEQYLYTGIGQREVKSNGWANESVKYFYGGDGCLYLAASVPAMIRFEYDGRGNLALREEGQRQTAYVYKDTRLQQVVLPGGGRIQYLYDQKGKNPVGPGATYYGSARKENLAMEYAWRDITRLASCFDHRTKMRYDFAYDGNTLVRVRLRGHAVSRLLRTNANDTELFVDCDQVNTPKVFTDRLGREVKYVDYDSFGIILDDTYPELFIPIGFAGGLLGRDTQLVRFGYRDYDPSVGRFTCPDPLGDTGGDHDVYDYCVDDPVNLSDPWGLFGMNGLSGFMHQQGLKEWEAQAKKVKPDHQTPEGLRQINKELEKPDTVGTPEFEQRVQENEAKAYGWGSSSRKTAQYLYGTKDDATLAKLGITPPPKADMEEMRKKPGHSRELEKELPEDPSPVRVEMTRDQLNKENELRWKKEESTVTTEQMAQDYVNNAARYALEDIKDPHNIVGAAAGAGGAVVLGLKGAAKILGSQAIGKGTAWGLKNLEEKGKGKNN